MFRFLHPQVRKVKHSGGGSGISGCSSAVEGVSDIAGWAKEKKKSLRMINWVDALKKLKDISG